MEKETKDEKKKEEGAAQIFAAVILICLCLFFGRKCFSCSEDRQEPPIEIPKVVMITSDSLLAVTYREKFDALYNDLMALDKEDDRRRSRGSFHKEIQKLFEDWHSNMEYLVDEGTLIPLCNKEYETLFRKYDKQFARFMLYGDEDTWEIERYAKREAENILRKLLVDPESLVIENVLCNGKTNKGWKYTVVYRAKNGFGGYVREKITVIMAYNGNTFYECVDAR